MASTDFLAVYDKQISKQIMLSFQEWPSRIPQLYHADSMDGPFTEHMGWRGYDLPQFRLPGEEIRQTVIHEDYSKRYTARSYGNGDSIPAEFIRDDPTGMLTQGGARIAGGIADSFKQLVELDATNYYLNGFTVTAGMADGVALYSASHPRAKSNAAVLDANRPTTGTALSVSEVQQSIIRLRTQYSPNNIPMMNTPRVLWTSPVLSFAARQILHQLQEPYTTEHNDNLIADYNIMHVELPYLGTSKAWGLIGEEHYNFFLWRQHYEAHNQYDAVTNSMQTFGTIRYDLGSSNYRGNDGSPGP